MPKSPTTQKRYLDKTDEAVNMKKADLSYRQIKQPIKNEKKLYYYLLVLLALGFCFSNFSCSKSDDDANIDSEASIVGKWKVTAMYTSDESSAPWEYWYGWDEDYSESYTFNTDGTVIESYTDDGHSSTITNTYKYYPEQKRLDIRRLDINIRSFTVEKLSSIRLIIYDSEYRDIMEKVSQ